MILPSETSTGVNDGAHHVDEQVDQNERPGELAAAADDGGLATGN